MPYTGSIKKGQAMDKPNLKQDITNIINGKRYKIYTTLDLDMVVEDLEKLGWENIDAQMNTIYAEKAGKKFFVDLDNIEWK